MNDKMLKAAEVMELHNCSLAKAYNIIKGLKKIHKLKYKDARISESIYREYYGVKV